MFPHAPPEAGAIPRRRPPTGGHTMRMFANIVLPLLAAVSTSGLLLSAAIV
jgi:hypothetical protein